MIDGATHICQLMMLCGVKNERAYTCDECIAGLDFVQGYEHILPTLLKSYNFLRYLLDDMEIREFTVYLEQNFCLPTNDRCPTWIMNNFPTMHRMAMEK